MGDLPVFESRVFFHTCCQHPHPGITGAGSEPLPAKEGETSGFLQRHHSGKGFLGEKPWLSNVKEVKKGEQRRARQGASGNSAATGGSWQE